MPNIFVFPNKNFCPNGYSIYEVRKNISICKTMITNNINIEHACEFSCACTTCHVLIKKGIESLDKASDSEEDLLDSVWGLSIYSRLSCQVKISNKDLLIEIPRYTINHAKEE